MVGSCNRIDAVKPKPKEGFCCVAAALKLEELVASGYEVAKADGTATWEARHREVSFQ